MLKLKFWIANVTCTARQWTFFKYFAELTHWGLTTFQKWQVVNTVKWHWRHSVFNHGQLDCLSNRLFRLATKQTQTFHITEFCENHLSALVYPHKRVGNAGIAIDIMTVTQHIVAQYGDIYLSTLTRVMACCLMEPNHYPNQCWLIIGKVQLQLSKGN